MKIFEFYFVSLNLNFSYIYTIFIVFALKNAFIYRENLFQLHSSNLANFKQNAKLSGFLL